MGRKGSSVRTETTTHARARDENLEPYVAHGRLTQNDSSTEREQQPANPSYFPGCKDLLLQLKNIQELVLTWRLINPLIQPGGRLLFQAHLPPL